MTDKRHDGDLHVIGNFTVHGNLNVHGDIKVTGDVTAFDGDFFILPPEKMPPPPVSDAPMDEQVERIVRQVMNGHNGNFSKRLRTAIRIALAHPTPPPVSDAPIGGWQVDAAIAKLKELRNHTCTRTAMLAVLQAAKLAPPPVSDDVAVLELARSEMLAGLLEETPKMQDALERTAEQLVAITRERDECYAYNLDVGVLEALKAKLEKAERERDEAREARNRWYVDYCQAERERDAHAATIAQIKETNQRQYDEGYAHATALHAATIARLTEALTKARRYVVMYHVDEYSDMPSKDDLAEVDAALAAKVTGSDG